MPYSLFFSNFELVAVVNSGYGLSSKNSGATALMTRRQHPQTLLRFVGHVRDLHFDSSYSRRVLKRTRASDGPKYFSKQFLYLQTVP
jgi:hypothetical protein